LASPKKKYEGRDQSRENQEKYVAERQVIDKKFPRKLASVGDAVDHIDHIV
jgi:hypothetical protein